MTKMPNTDEVEKRLQGPIDLDIGAFGIKLNLPISALPASNSQFSDSSGETHNKSVDPNLKEWKSIRRECTAYLQGSIVGLVALLFEITCASIRITKGIAAIVESIALLIRRISRAESNTDSRKKRSNEENECGPL